MKKRIQEERERIISLLGINEQEEIRAEKPEITLKDKLDNLTLFSSKNGSEIKTNIEDINDDKIKSLQKMGHNYDTALLKSIIKSKGHDKDGMNYNVLGGSFPTKFFEIQYDGSNLEGDKYDGDLMFDYFKVESDTKNGDDFNLIQVSSDELDIKEKPEVDKEGEDISKDVENQEPVQQEPEQPFEEEMKQKEKKGLASLLDGNEPSNDFTKRQKKVLEKLKGEGYLLNRPENEEGYIRKKVTSKEFTESFNVWEPKK